MPHFKDTENKLHFIDDIKFSNILPCGSVEITDEEAMEIAVEAQRPKTDEEKIAAIQLSVTTHLDQVAKSKGYDNIQSAAIRAGFPGPFNGEGVAFAMWMDACWAKCYQLLSEVKSGHRPEMTSEEVAAELPALVLP